MNSLLPSLALFTFGFGEMLVLFAIIMLLFGAKKLPGLARGLGAGIRNFKGELKPPPDDEDSGEG
ncbi:MAG: twin-arginine translocase TatA/TatE family subunit [Gemmatimonadota bacterium]